VLDRVDQLVAHRGVRGDEVLAEAVREIVWMASEPEASDEDEDRAE
jgi:hypothetical protein